MGGSVRVRGTGGTLTVDKQGDLALAHANAGDDGFADVLPRVSLGDRFQVQLVAVAQDLDANTAGASGRGYRTPPWNRPPARPPHPTMLDSFLVQVRVSGGLPDHTHVSVTSEPMSVTVGLGSTTIRGATGVGKGRG